MPGSTNLQKEQLIKLQQLQSSGLFKQVSPMGEMGVSTDYNHMDVYLYLDVIPSNSPCTTMTLLHILIINESEIVTERLV